MSKKKLLLVADVKNWAFWHMAQGIAKYAPPEYDVQVIDNLEFGQYTKYTPGALMDFSGVCQMGWPESSTPGKNGIFWNYSSVVVASHGLEFDWPVKDPSHLPSRIATRLRNKDNARKKLPQFDRVICVSPRLQELAAQYNRESVFCMPGVDDEIFCPAPKKPPEMIDMPPSTRDLSNPEEVSELISDLVSGPPFDFGKPRALRVGWCGQRRGVTKGFAEVLEPLVKELGDTDFEWCINDRDQSDALSQAEMVEWYRGLDVFINTSFSEGASQTVMEAMACGVPVVATECGMAKQTAWLMTVPYTTEDTHHTLKGFVNNLRGYQQAVGECHKEGAHCARFASNSLTWRNNAARWCKAIAGEEIK